MMRAIQRAFRITFVFSSLLVSGMAVSQGGGGGGDWEVNNGGSLASRVVQLAYYKVDRLARSCLVGNPCRLTGRERETLERIVGGLAEQYQKQPRIHFASEKARPGFFVIDDEVKAAKTGDRVGSPIYFNQDLLYTRNFTGTLEAIQFGEAVAQIVHELGHHHGDLSHSELDVLGAKVALGTSSLMLSSPVLPNSRAINIQVLNSVSADAFPDVFLQVYDDVVDITSIVRDKIRCPLFTVPVPIRRVPDIDLLASKAQGAKYHNLHWSKFQEDETKGGGFELVMSVSALCRARRASNLEWQREAKVRIGFRVRKNAQAPKGWSLDLQTLLIESFRDQWWKIIALPLL